jgi:hypothetical protein
MRDDEILRIEANAIKVKSASERSKCEHDFKRIITLSGNRAYTSGGWNFVCVRCGMKSRDNHA